VAARFYRSVGFIDGENGFHAAIRVEHQTDVVQLDGVFAGVLPHAEADVAAFGVEERVFEFGAVAVPGFVGLEEREVRRRGREDARCAGDGVSGVDQMPQADDRMRVEIVPIILIRVSGDERGFATVGAPAVAGPAAGRLAFVSGTAQRAFAPVAAKDKLTSANSTKTAARRAEYRAFRNLLSVRSMCFSLT
jgi:hypothetical protein